MEKCQKYVTDFSNTPNNFLEKAVKCVTDLVVEARDDVNKALESAKQIEQDLNTIDTDIDNCNGNKWKQAKCFAKIIEKIAKDTKEAPQKIIENAGKVVNLIATFVPRVEACILDKLKGAGKDAAEDVAEFAICAAI